MKYDILLHMGTKHHVECSSSASARLGMKGKAALELNLMVMVDEVV